MRRVSRPPSTTALPRPSTAPSTTLAIEPREQGAHEHAQPAEDPDEPVDDLGLDAAEHRRYRQCRLDDRALVGVVHPELPGQRKTGAAIAQVPVGVGLASLIHEPRVPDAGKRGTDGDTGQDQIELARDVLAQVLAERVVGQRRADETGRERQRREDDERGGHHPGRFVSVLALAQRPGLGEEGQERHAAHVEGGQGRDDEPRDQEPGVARGPRGEEDLVLAPEPRERRDAGE